MQRLLQALTPGSFQNNNMASIEQEDKAFQADVAAAKSWWKGTRWRYTKRPYTAEQIVAKRGNLRIEYPSDAQSKKLWQILEGRFQASQEHHSAMIIANRQPEWRCQFHIRLSRSSDAHSNGKIPRHRLCLWLAMLFDCIFH
jgi:hypothetical protein